MSRIIVSVSVTLLAASLSLAATPKRLLLLGQGPDGHAATTHEYMAGMHLLAKCLEQVSGVEVTVVRADDPWTEGPALLREADGVVLYLSQGARWLQANPQRLQAFQELAGRGGAIVGLHWAIGTTKAEDVPAYVNLVGGCHGGPDRKYKVLETDVRVADRSHPIAFGVDDFRDHDEYYYALKLAPAPAQVTPILRADIAGKAETVAWAWERPDGGRSFGYSGLHFYRNWDPPACRRMVAQGVLWTLKLAIPKTGLNVDVDYNPGKLASSLYPARLVNVGKKNAEKHAWAAQIRDGIVEAAQPWMQFTDDELWALMFGPTIPRSWMVWSDGHCPACNESVPMYNWEVDALKRPWKVRCPHCEAMFPTNDFKAFYDSGLDEHGVFNPKRADRKLLFNAEHPDSEDPLRTFGVDDGQGFAQGKKRWRFIGAYLVYGQWKHAVLDGIRKLAATYVATGDKAYAHKAGILLDRVADLYPTFDFHKQALLYEKVRGHGYVSVWHDACEETRELVLAYDQVFEGLKRDGALVEFLAGKAKQHKLDNPKRYFADIQRNIEDRILRDALAHPGKIHSNYPRAEITKTIIHTVLGQPENRDAAKKLIDAFVKRATAVDGVTGEKGLANYSAFVLQAMAQFLAEFARVDEAFLPDLLKRHPQLHKTYRFHIDTWCLGKYYPLSGDTGWFAALNDQYKGVLFPRGSLAPSTFAFLYELYKLTGDSAFVQVLYRANDNRVEGLPHAYFRQDGPEIQKRVAEVIAREGPEPKLPSIDKQQWHLGILRSGEGDHRRAAWLDYDAGGGHSHVDGMNLGLFAHGLDLMPDFGYPPVQFGGWGSPKSAWYRMTAAHNTVVVDGKGQRGAAGRTTLWGDGKTAHVIRASAPKIIGGKQYERTVASIDVSDAAFYVVDVFRVVGGRDHAKFLHSHFGKITTEGLSLEADKDYGHNTQMRSFRTDRAPAPGWHVDWKIEDRYELLPPGTQVHLRYTDLTTEAAASTAEGWVVAGIYSSTDEAWIPRIMVRRRAETEPLASTFVGVLEPYAEQPSIKRIRRLPLQTSAGKPFADSHVALEIQLADGRRDLFIAADTENPLAVEPAATKTPLVQPEWKAELAGALCMIRRSPSGDIERIALGKVTSVRVADVSVALKEGAEFIELRFDQGRPTVVSGKRDAVERIRVEGKDIEVR